MKGLRLSSAHNARTRQRTWKMEAKASTTQTPSTSAADNAPKPPSTDPLAFLIPGMITGGPSVEE